MTSNDPSLVYWVPIASLIVAALAVFVGPIISWRIAKKSSDTSLHVAHKQVIAPMRQKWIDNLRDRVADIISTAHWYYVSGMDEVVSLAEDEDWERESQQVDRKLIFLLNQVELMLNPNEKDHIDLIAALREVVHAAHRSGSAPPSIADAVEKANTICKQVLKREWEVVKREGVGS